MFIDNKHFIAFQQKSHYKIDKASGDMLRALVGCTDIDLETAQKV